MLPSGATPDPQVAGPRPHPVNEGSGRAVATMMRFGRHDGGATAIEYGLIASLIIVAVIVALQSVATNANAVFSAVANAVVPPN